MFGSSLHPVGGGRMSYLSYLCLFAHSGVEHIVCCVFLRLVYHMIPLSQNCPFLISPSVFSNVYFSDEQSNPWTSCDIMVLSIADWLIFGVYLHFQQYFSYIMATSFNGGRSPTTRREPTTVSKQLVSVITCGLSIAFCHS